MSAPFLLTDEERGRFSAYLEQVAWSNEGIVRQMVEIAVPEELIARLRAEAKACRLVSEMLRSTTSFSFGSD